MKPASRLLVVTAVLMTGSAFAQGDPAAPLAPKTSTQGTDSKEPTKTATTPKTSTQGTDSKEPAKASTKPKASFQGTDSKETPKKTPNSTDPSK
jgi:hypothetical protein